MSFKFSMLFVGSLSVDHLHRVWDIFREDEEESKEGELEAWGYTNPVGG